MQAGKPKGINVLVWQCCDLRIARGVRVGLKRPVTADLHQHLVKRHALRLAYFGFAGGELVLLAPLRLV